MSKSFLTKNDEKTKVSVDTLKHRLLTFISIREELNLPKSKLYTRVEVFRESRETYLEDLVTKEILLLCKLKVVVKRMTIQRVVVKKAEIRKKNWKYFDTVCDRLSILFWSIKEEKEEKSNSPSTDEKFQTIMNLLTTLTVSVVDVRQLARCCTIARGLLNNDTIDRVSEELRIKSFECMDTLFQGVQQYLPKFPDPESFFLRKYKEYYDFSAVLDCIDFSNHYHFFKSKFLRSFSSDQEEYDRHRKQLDQLENELTVYMVTCGIVMKKFYDEYLKDDCIALMRFKLRNGCLKDYVNPNFVIPVYLMMAICRFLQLYSESHVLCAQHCHELNFFKEAIWNCDEAVLKLFEARDFYIRFVRPTCTEFGLEFVYPLAQLLLMKHYSLLNILKNRDSVGKDIKVLFVSIVKNIKPELEYLMIYRKDLVIDHCLKDIQPVYNVKVEGCKACRKKGELKEPCKVCNKAHYCSRKCMVYDIKKHFMECEFWRILRRIGIEGKISKNKGRCCCVCGMEEKVKKLFQCSRCKKVQYCSRACQSKDWKQNHKNVCKKN